MSLKQVKNLQQENEQLKVEIKNMKLAKDAMGTLHDAGDLVKTVAHMNQQTANIKEIEEIAADFEKQVTECIAENDGLTKGYEILELKNSGLIKEIEQFTHDKEVAQALVVQLKQEIQDLHAKKLLPEAMDLAVMDDLKKEVEIQSAKAMAADVQLSAWREWAKTFPKIPKKQ